MMQNPQLAEILTQAFAQFSAPAREGFLKSLEVSSVIDAMQAREFERQAEFLFARSAALNEIKNIVPKFYAVLNEVCDRTSYLKPVASNSSAISQFKSIISSRLQQHVLDAITFASDATGASFHTEFLKISKQEHLLPHKRIHFSLFTDIPELANLVRNVSCADEQTTNIRDFMFDLIDLVSALQNGNGELFKISLEKVLKGLAKFKSLS